VLKLKCDELLSNFAFNFNLRRYHEVSNMEYDMAEANATDSDTPTCVFHAMGVGLGALYRPPGRSIQYHTTGLGDLTKPPPFGFNGRSTSVCQPLTLNTKP
jgi:hypothetical protein